MRKTRRVSRGGIKEGGRGKRVREGKTNREQEKGRESGRKDR